MFDGGGSVRRCSVNNLASARSVKMVELVDAYSFKSLRRTGAGLVDTVIRAIFPGRCLDCGELFRSNPRNNDGHCLDSSLSTTDLAHLCFNPFVCPHCLGGFQSIDSPMCTCCGTPFKARSGRDHLCGECISSPKYFRTARAVGVYEGMFRSVIHAFKYGGNVRLAAPLGRILLKAVCRESFQTPYDLMLPVPLHPSRMRQRGFNQAFLLLRQWRKLMPVSEPPWGAVPLEKSILIRTRRTMPQTGLGRRRRNDNIRRAFMLTHKRWVEGKTVLLVDDVLTTGATVNECARMLVKGGAAAVDVVTLARAVF